MRELKQRYDHTVTCRLAAGTDLNVFGVWRYREHPQHGRDGQFRLAYLESESAVIELER